MDFSISGGGTRAFHSVQSQLIALVPASKGGYSHFEFFTNTPAMPLPYIPFN